MDDSANDDLRDLRLLLTKMLAADVPSAAELERLSQLAANVAARLREGEVVRKGLLDSLVVKLTKVWSVPDLDPVALLSAQEISTLEKLGLLLDKAMVAKAALDVAEKSVAETLPVAGELPDYGRLAALAEDANRRQREFIGIQAEVSSLLDGALGSVSLNVDKFVPSEAPVTPGAGIPEDRQEPGHLEEGGKTDPVAPSPPAPITEPEEGEMAFSLPLTEAIISDGALVVADLIEEDAISSNDTDEEFVIPPCVTKSCSSPCPGVATEGNHAPEPRPDAFWRAVETNRLGVAEALLKVGAIDADSRRLLEAALSITVAALIVTADGNGEEDYWVRGWGEAALEEWQPGKASDQVMLAAGTLLLPSGVLLALLAPGSTPSSFLSALLHVRLSTNEASLAQALPALAKMARDIEHASSLTSGQLFFGPKLLADLVSKEQWEKELADHSRKIGLWLEGQRAKKLRYAAATDVWLAALRPKPSAPASLGSVLDLAVCNNYTRPQTVRDLIKGFQFERDFRALEVEVRGKATARRSPIAEQAWRELESRANEAMRLIREWLAIVERAPTQNELPHATPAAELRKSLAASMEEAVAELGAVTVSEQVAAAQPAKMVLGRLADLLAGKIPAPRDSNIKTLLGRDLLSLVSVRFQAGFLRPERLSNTLFPQLIDLAFGDSSDFDLYEAAKKRLEAGDFLGAVLARDLIPPSEQSDMGLDRDIRRATDDARQKALRDVDEIRSEVETAERAGRLGVGDTQVLVAKLDESVSNIEYADPSTLKECLDSVESLRKHASVIIGSAEEQVRKRINLRLDELGQVDEVARHRIEMAIQARQFAIAEDCIERLEDGIVLEDNSSEPPPVATRFDAFFPERADALANWLRSGDGPGIHRLFTLLGRSATLPDPLGTLSAGAQSDAQRLLAAWKQCAAVKGAELKTAIVELFGILGFTEPKCPRFDTPSHSATEALFHLNVRPLRQRETAILPEFGSVAAGNYSLLCLWHKRDVDDIAEALARAKFGAGTVIVLFFGVLDAMQRRRLANMARADQVRSALVLDETLLAHLALLSEARLPNFFACTIPFADSLPWADTGTPAPEMFFGRRREMRAIEAMSGEFTQLIYGGRQLGKTAMLRQVERDAADRMDTVARYLSIAQIGLGQPLDSIWLEMAGALKTANICIQLQQGQKQAASFRSQVLDWLRRNPAQRILLLFDEADCFFESDRSSNYSTTEMLRTLSVETDRRFKPVFAGLHNVQKLARDPNSPIAHLGQPLVVGPLIRGQERAEAEALVRWPFAALGYRMEPTVFTRILSFANYYPSLIQVVCQRLLRSLRERRGGMGPPWTVTIKDVETVLATREVQDAAFERFRITLILDQRYNLLAMIAAQLSEPEFLARGIDTTLLRELAALSWPAGFPAELSDDAFSALLDEMEGLGLLRRVNQTHYALRSQNLVHLIGTQEDIETRITAIAKQEYPGKPDPLEQRRPVNEFASILTARQESELLANRNGAIVLAGIDASDLDSFTNCLKAAVEFQVNRQGADFRLEQTKMTESVTGFRQRVDALAKRNDGGNILLVIPREHPWDSSWVKYAHTCLAAKESSKRSSRVIFVADAKRAYAWAFSDEEGRHSLIGEGGNQAVVEMTIGPWSLDSLRLWFSIDDHDKNLPDWLKNDMETLLTGTGGWVKLLADLVAGHFQPKGCTGDELAATLAVPSSSGEGFFADVAALPKGVEILLAIATAEEFRSNDDTVDGEFIAQANDNLAREIIDQGLAWAKLIGGVSYGASGIKLNSLLRALLPHLAKSHKT